MGEYGGDGAALGVDRRRLGRRGAEPGAKKEGTRGDTTRGAVRPNTI